MTAEPQPLAARLASLDGIRLGVLDNSKWNASKRTALGADRIEAAVITHPLSTLTDDEIVSRAVEAAAQVKRILTGA